jgi:hypothetical protein
VTLEKGGKEARFHYKDKFLSQDTFQWESQNKATQASNDGQAIREADAKGYQVQLFVRRTNKVAGKTQPFIYCGKLRFEECEGEKPIKVIWKLETPVSKSTYQQLTGRSSP